MTTPMLLRLFAVILGLSVALSHAQQRGPSPQERLVETGGAFLKTCAAIEKPTKALSSSELLDANYCVAYVTGFVDALQVTAELYREPVVCFPDAGLDVRETAKIVLAYIRERPERKGRTTAVLVGAALAREFPCRR